MAPNGLTPGWMREGIADWQETLSTGRGRANFSYTEMVLRSAIYDNAFPKIDQIAGLGIKWPGSNSQYLYGMKFIQWLGEKYGEEAITRYMEEYSSGLWLFSLNNKARRVFNKSFYKLWKEWKNELSAKYAGLKVDLTEKGLTPFQPFIANKDQLSYPTPNPSGTGYAYTQSGIDDAARIVIVTKPGKEPLIVKRKTIGQLAYSRNGGSYLAFSSISSIEPYRSLADVYVYNTKKKKIFRLYEKKNRKKSLRATDPDFAPFDGGVRWVLMVRTRLGTDNLYVYDWKKKKGYYLTDAPKYTQFSNPRFSPNGNRIVVSRKDHEGNRDLVLYDKTGNEIKKLTNDEANDTHPVWTPSGNHIYFGSDKSGVPNIYRYHLSSGAVQQMTNVLTGVYQPQIVPHAETLYVKYYTSKGSDLYQVYLSDLNPHYVDAGDTNSESGEEAPVTAGSEAPLNLQNIDQPKEEQNSYVLSPTTTPLPSSSNYADEEQRVPINPSAGYVTPDGEEKGPDKSSQKLSHYETLLQDKKPPVQKAKIVPGSKKYNPFPQILVPRYIVPTFAILDDAALIGFSTGRFDPLFRHTWNLNTFYRSDANFLGASATYSYVRYFPTFTVGIIRYAVNWGNLFGTGTNFFEQRARGFIGASFALRNHALSSSYFYEDRRELSGRPVGTSAPSLDQNLDRYAGFRFRYTYGRFKQFPNSISRENGPYLKLGLDVTNSIFGSAEANELVIFTGDFRYYFEMPWADHHVFALRAAGGFAWGDPQFQGTFRFGGPFGEGNLAGYSDHTFPFRGLPGITFASERVMLFSGEYRLPLANIERGIGTWPIFLNKINLTMFSDFGDSWFQNGKVGRGFFQDFFLSVGAELSGDGVIGYGLPVRVRLGYAIILKNRSQVAGLKDDLFGIDIKYGTVYFNFGTTF